MDIEVIMNHRVKAETIIRNTLHANGVQPTESLIEEFLSFYDYNGLSSTINNIYRYSNKVTNRLEDQRHLQLQLVSHH
jgi:hypothetical protein